jgi:hypothetical protein
MRARGVQHGAVVQAERIELAIPDASTPMERQELGAIARYCVNRVESTLGPPDSWFVRVGAVNDGFACTVVVHDRGCAIETTSMEPDGALAIWDAVREVEQVLRDVRASRTWRPRRASAA